MINQIADEILSLIELEEARLLKWGFVSGELDLDRELSRLVEGSKVWNSAEIHNITIPQIIDNLLDRCLIFATQRGYRSRFAETVRLLFLLKQRFSFQDWLTAPRLVSDYKLELRRRQYPKRNIKIASLRNSLKPLNLSFLQYQVIEGLLQDNQGNHFELARFQVDATVQQFYNLKARSDRALAIGAGTGAGKTKAFYIPALAFLAEQIDHRRNTQIIAIYPRTELLKDQLKETFSEARKLDKILAAAGKRPIAIGAYYGDVPFGTGRFDATQRQKWGHGNWLENEQLDGYECPYFVCHKNDCNEAAMVWRKAHLEQQQEILTCTNCGNEVHDLQLMLTRNSMVNSPPDILFTTTEMLNRRLSKSKEHALFGIDAQQPPRLVLLDEIHT
ncbi:MAG: DEAD/DEAH box helicase, partial [Candidatus Promineifilaceae bacterium]